MFPAVLEIDFGSYLEDPLPERRGELPKASATDTIDDGARGARIAPVRRVAEVQCVKPHLQAKSLCELEGAEEAEVELSYSWPSQPRQSPAPIADSNGLYRDKGGRVEVLLARAFTPGHLEIPGEVRDLTRARSVEEAGRLARLKRRARDTRDDAVDLPAAKQCPGSLAGVGPFLAGAEWHVANKRHLQHVGMVEAERVAVQRLAAVRQQRIGRAVKEQVVARR